MKKYLLIQIVALVIILLAGCGTNDKSGGTDRKPQQNGDNTAGYQFDYNGIAIHMNDKAEKIVDTLGKPLEYFEAPSCAFQGLDKIYYYSGFNLSTYPGTDGDYVSAIDFSDDSVSTKEGITLGTSRDKVTGAYGNDYTEDNGSLIYTKDKTRLTFLMEGDSVSSINYEFITD